MTTEKTTKKTTTTHLSERLDHLQSRVSQFADDMQILQSQLNTIVKRIEADMRQVIEKVNQK